MRDALVAFVAVALLSLTGCASTPQASLTSDADAKEFGTAPNAAKVFELFFQWVQSGFSMDLPPQAGLLVPFFKEVSYPLGVFGFVILTYLVIVGSSNAVNLTDGLDGLAIMPVVMVGASLSSLAGTKALRNSSHMLMRIFLRTMVR